MCKLKGSQQLCIYLPSGSYHSSHQLVAKKPWLLSTYVYLYTKWATSLWGATSYTIYCSHMSVALIPLNQFIIKERETKTTGKLYQHSLMSCEAWRYYIGVLSCIGVTWKVPRWILPSRHPGCVINNKSQKNNAYLHFWTSPYLHHLITLALLRVQMN